MQLTEGACRPAVTTSSALAAFEEKSIRQCTEIDCDFRMVYGRDPVACV